MVLHQSPYGKRKLHNSNISCWWIKFCNSVKVKINTTTGDADVTEAVTLGAGDDTVTYHSAQRLDTADVIALVVVLIH